MNLNFFLSNIVVFGMNDVDINLHLGAVVGIIIGAILSLMIVSLSKKVWPIYPKIQDVLYDLQAKHVDPIVNVNILATIGNHLYVVLRRITSDRHEYCGQIVTYQKGSLKTPISNGYYQVISGDETSPKFHFKKLDSLEAEQMIRELQVRES